MNPSSDVWLINEARPAGAETERVVATQMLRVTRGRATRKVIAVRLTEVIVRNNRKWFGGADIRIDALVVHGETKEAAQKFYAPGTFRFSGVADGAHLPLENLLMFYGRPKHFLDLFLTVSRDTKDSDDLADLLQERGGAEDFQDATKVILGLGMATPQAGAIVAGLGAAVVLGKTAYDVLRGATGATIGLYHGSWLEAKDGFGIGPHPAQGLHQTDDLAFRFEIVVDEAAGDLKT
jgi:hypothetical protein